MKKRLVRWLAMCGVILFCINPAFALAVEYHKPIGDVEIPAEIETFDSALLIDLNTMSSLYAKDIDRTFSPTGGAVSLMAAYVVLQEADWEQEIPVIDGVLTLPSGTRKLDLQPGKRWLVKDLVAAMLLYGAQDAALVLCDHVSGSQDAFVSLMNQYAERLGMKNTVYKNPLGAYASGQTTTVLDLLLLSMKVLESDALRSLLGKSTYDTVNGQIIKNRMDIMQGDRSGYDDRIKGLGEGSTTTAGTNTILYAVEGDRACLFVGYTEVGDQKSSEQNAIALLDFFTESYLTFDVTDIIHELLKNQQITTDDGTVVIPATQANQCFVTMEKSISNTVIGSSPSAFVLGKLPTLSVTPQADEEIGTVTLILNECPVASIPLVADISGMDAAQPVTQEDFKIPIYAADDWDGSKKKQSIIDRYGSWIIIGAAVLLSGVVLFAADSFRRKRH